MDKMKIIESAIADYQDELFRFAFFRIGSTAQAQDIVQDCFVKMFSDNYDLSRIKNIRAYLFRSIANKCNDFLRKKKRDIQVPVENIHLKICDESVDDILHEYEHINKIMACIPEEQAEVIKMKTINDLSFVEIADILGIPVTTAKSRFKYGIDKLRAKIN